jgi:hypothetical protein
MSKLMTVANKTVAMTLDIGQRLFSLFVASALPAITGGAVIGVSVLNSALIAGFMAVAGVLQKLAAASTDGELTKEEITQAFSK